MRTRAPSGGGLFGGIGYASSNANAATVVCTDCASLPYLARNICGHRIPLRTSFAKWDFNIGRPAHAFKNPPIELCDCSPRFNDKTNLPARRAGFTGP